MLLQVQAISRTDETPLNRPPLIHRATQHKEYANEYQLRGSIRLSRYRDTVKLLDKTQSTKCQQRAVLAYSLPADMSSPSHFRHFWSSRENAPKQLVFVLNFSATQLQGRGWAERPPHRATWLMHLGLHVKRARSLRIFASSRHQRVQKYPRCIKRILGIISAATEISKILKISESLPMKSRRVVGFVACERSRGERFVRNLTYLRTCVHIVLEKTRLRH